MFLAMDFRASRSTPATWSSATTSTPTSFASTLALGEKVGDENVVCGIEELCAKCMGEGVLNDGIPPTLRYARHRGRVKADYQVALEARVKKCWDAITSGHVFTDLPLEDSKARCEVLDEMAVGLMSSGTDLDNWFNEVTRPPRF
jgi:hypothetical protein